MNGLNRMMWGHIGLHWVIYRISPSSGLWGQVAFGRPLGKVIQKLMCLGFRVTNVSMS